MMLSHTMYTSLPMKNHWWHQITYTIDCSFMNSGEHTLYVRAEKHDAAGTIESIEMDSASFIIE